MQKPHCALVANAENSVTAKCIHFLLQFWVTNLSLTVNSQGDTCTAFPSSLWGRKKQCKPLDLNLSNLGLTDYTYEWTATSYIVISIYCSLTASLLRGKKTTTTGFHTNCFTDAFGNARPFFCGRMVLSFAPDSCAGLLFALSWVVLIKLCCRTSEKRLMDAQEVWQLSEDAGQSGPAAICSLSFTALLMEKQNQTTWIWALQTHIHTHAHTENTKHHFMW